MAWLRRVRWNAWLLALVVAVLGWFLHEFAFGAGIVNLSYDLLHLLRNHEIPANEAVIVYLDEKSHLELGQPLNAPWDRAIHAQMIDRLTAASARAVVMDIVFSDANPDKTEADQKLADAIKRSGRVILGTDYLLTANKQREYIPPFPLLRDNAAAIGSVEMTPSRDLIVRAHAPNEQLSSMSWAAAEFLAAPITKKITAEAFQPSPDTPRAEVKSWINYYGRPDWLQHGSYSDVLASGRVPDSVFRDKVVFIGARMITKLQNERNDAYRNPYSFWITKQKGDSPFISGVEIQATMFLNVLRGDWLRRLPTPVELSSIAVLGLLAGYGLMRLRPGFAILAAVLALALVALLSREVFIRQLIWFPWLILYVQIAFALLCSVAVNSIRLYVENRLFVQSLEMYLSPKLVKKFAADKDRKLLKPGAEKQKLTILFSDIAGFTSVSEGMDSDELARMMNEYFQGAVGTCIHATDGTVVKYIGDAIFAFWNAPDPQDDHAVRACEAALRFRELSKKPVAGRQLITRIGLHTGVANVGNFGSQTRVDYTAIGENINLASRMEGLNKYLGTDVLITGDVKKEIGDRFVTRYLGRFQLKGFEKSVEVYELVGLRESSIAPQWHGEFAEALRLFQQRDFSAAGMAFERVLESADTDYTTKFYVKHLAEVRDQALPENWNGEVELKEK
ncbi:MAG TPA: adenylate/guanylate cyclase domain-containing protein [Candidatus Limnocylindria bacterium]|nr:adenylate/guanylate cyclase domain-containing protein [Candidatus Limnocylindria bacterium]